MKGYSQTETQRQKQKIMTRKHLIEVAMKLYAEKGLTKTPTAELAKAAGVSHGTVFAHFSTQEALLTDVIDEFGSRINNRLHHLASGKSGVREVLTAHIDGLKEFESFYTKLVMENHLLPQEARNTFIMIQSTISFHLSQVLEEEIKSGTVLALPIHLIFNGWIGLVHHYLINSDLFAPEGSVLERYGSELINHYMKLIEPKI